MKLKSSQIKQAAIALAPALLIVCSLAIPTRVQALPDGRVRLPNIKVPKLPSGRSLPVEFIGSDRSPNEIYVKPLEGMLISREAKISYAGAEGANAALKSQCDEIGSFFEARHDDRAIVVELNKLLKKDLADILAYESTISDAEKSKAPILNEKNNIKSQIAADETALSTYKAAVADLDSKRAELKRARGVALDAKDTTEVARLDEEIIDIARRTQKAQADVDTTAATLRRENAAMRVYDSKLAEIDGELSGYQNSLDTIAKHRDDLQHRVDEKVTKFEQYLTSYANEFAGYMKFTMDFAPREFLSSLQAANPELTFLYVPSLAAAVDITFPAVDKNSPIAGKIGNMIHGQKWDNASDTWQNNALVKKLLDAGTTSADSKAEDFMKKLEEISQAYSDDLSGLKQLTVELTTFGACAMVYPQSFPEDLNPTGSIVALSVAYNYPVKYDIHVTGTHKIHKSLYELYKRSSSSSWFGFKKSERQDFVRTITGSEFMNIKVDSSSPNFKAEDAEDLRQEMADLLAFNSVKDQLDFTKAAPDPNFGDIHAERAPSKIGSMMMLVKVNPWVFWGGFALKTLDNMFGSNSNTSTNTQTMDKDDTVDETMNFVSQHSGSITVGSLKTSDFNK